MVDTASLPSVRDDLRAALIADDRAALLVFASHLPDRLGKVSDQEIAQRPELGEARADIRRMLSQVREKLRDTSVDPVRKLAGDVNGRASEVSGAAYRRRVQAALDADIQSGRKVAWPS